MSSVSKFNSPLLVEELTEPDWRLFADFSYDSAHLGRMVVVPAGFVTDFASVPRLPFVYWLTGGLANKAAVVHDWFYRSCTASRADADAVFKEAMGVLGQPAWRCQAMYAGLRAFGGAAYCTGKNSSDSGFGNARALGLNFPPPINPRLIRSVPYSAVNKSRKLGYHPTVKELL